MAPSLTRSHETLKFQQTKMNGKNPVFSDGTRELTVNNNGINVVFYACAVYMTRFMQSEEAKTTQLNLMDMTASNVKVTNAYNDAISKILDTMEESAMNGKGINSDKLIEILEEYTDTSKYLYRNKLMETSERLNKIHEIYVNGNFKDPIGVIRSSMSMLKNTENNIRATVNEMDITLRLNSTSNVTYGKTDCIPKLQGENDKDYRNRIGELNRILEEQGYIKINRFKRDSWDENGNRIPNAGKEVSKTLANPKNLWLFDSSIVVSGSNKSTTFKLTEYGKGIFTELYREAEAIRSGSKLDNINITKEKFDAEFMHQIFNR